MNELIQWPRAKYWNRAWNPIVGCKPVSPACEHCYAKAWAERFGQSFEPHYAFRRPRPTRGVVFAGNMTDLFGPWNSEPSMTISAGASAGKDATAYLWLTKRPGRMHDALSSLRFHEAYTKPGRNHFFGYTGEDQEWYEKRFKEFRRIPTIFKGWLSAEPLLGQIDLGLRNVSSPEAMPFQWVVVGCESGPRRRPCKVEWVESIVEQCQEAGVPVFVKQLDLGGKVVTDIERFPEHLRVRQVPWRRPTERPRQNT